MWGFEPKPSVQLFKAENKVKYLGVMLSNMNCMMFHNNYFKAWKEIKSDLLRWEHL